jgi:hypothetical protein
MARSGGGSHGCVFSNVLGSRLVVGDVWQRWTPDGFPYDHGSMESACRSDLSKKVDERNLTKRFVRFVGVGDDNTYGCRSPPYGHHYGFSLMRCGL